MLATAGTLAELADPEAGDILNLLLVAGARSRLNSPLSLVDLEFMPSLAGLVWRSLADGLSAVPTPGGIDLSRSGGLRSASGSWRPGPTVPPPGTTPAVERHEGGRDSDDTSSKRPGDAGDDLVAASLAVRDDHGSAAAPPRTPGMLVEPLALAGVLGRGGPPLATLRQDLLGKLAASEGAEAYSTRLRLARLFLADALGAEALAVLESAAADERSKGTAEAPKREAALRAAADFLLGRDRHASELLAAIPADGDAELALWRAAVAAALEKWDEAARELTGAGRIWADYPPRLKFRLGLMVAGVLGQAGRVDPALAVIDQLADLPLSPLDSAKLSLLRASLLDRDGRGAVASTAFAEAVRDGGLEVGITARFLRVVSGRERGDLPADEARRRLTDDRLLWRGHAQESRMLDALAGLQAEGGDPAAALATWQVILSRELDEAKATNALDRMRKALTRALTTDNPAAVDPVTGLALLRAFPTLLPGSETGHQLVNDVARRLAESGLPAQAGGLLAAHHARVGPPTASGLLDLARYHLAADEPDATLATFARVDTKTLSNGGQRSIAEARALLATGRAGDALRVIEKASGPESSELRALSLWRLGAWSRLREELVPGTANVGGTPTVSAGCAS